MAKRQIRMGLSMRYLGYHDAAWRHPEVPSDGASSFRHFLRCARRAEEGLFDMVFFADGIGVRAEDNPPGSLSHSNRNVELEPLTLLSALAPMTERIGLVTTASTTYNEPYHIARKFASLDQISGGRAGWNIVTSWSQQEALNFSRESHLDYETRYERAAEFVAVVTGLWDSWAPGAFVRDKATGQYYEPAKLHTLRHRGRHFQVRGPLSVDRTPQGRPILVQAGASDAGRELAAATADVVYAAAATFEDARAYYADVKSRMARYGRAPDELKIMPGLMAVPGVTERQARERYEVLQALVDPLVGLNAIANYLGDLSGYPLDGPVPEPEITRLHSRGRLFADMARRNNYSIRELYLAIAGGNGHHTIIGTPCRIVDEMERWFDGGAADGFNFLPPWLPGGLDDVVDQVVPELQRRGLMRTAYEATTLRANLGAAPACRRFAPRVSTTVSKKGVA